MLSHSDRNKWLQMPDDKLFQTCRMEAFKASGHGGQKVNKTSSAVRIVHEPTNIEAVSSESRSQHENRHIALEKLRIRIAMEVRCQELVPPENMECSPNNTKYAIWLAWICDILDICEFRMKDASEKAGMSTGRLVRLLQRDKLPWQKINKERQLRGMNPLRISE